MKKILQIALTVVIASGSFRAVSQVIDTRAGNGTAGLSGIGGTGFTAEINAPSGVAVDASGNLYFSDGGNNQVKMVNSCGTISVVAGSATGVAGSTGDGGAATAAKLSAPAGLAFDATGNLYVCDQGNQVVRKINTSGTISTVAGTIGSSGNTGDGSAATSAKLDAPRAVAVDGSGNLYISDANNNRIRKVTASSGFITNFAGSSVGLPGSTGDGGAATAARLTFPAGIALDASGNLIVADESNNKIRKIDGVSGVITTIAGTGTAGYSGDGGAATAATLSDPAGIFIDGSNNIYFADQANNKIRLVNAAGNISLVAGASTAGGYGGDGGAATAATFNTPYFVAVSGSGTIYCSDKINNRVRAIFTNHAPAFAGSHLQTATTCANATALSVDGLLAAHDTDCGQTLTWSVLNAPNHGALSGGYSAVSTGCGTLTPTGFNYTPANGFSGTDSFTIKVSDGTSYDSTIIVYTVNALPNAGSIVGSGTICIGNTATYTETVTGGTWAISNGNATLALIAGGVKLTSASRGLDTLTYSVSNLAGCSARFSKMVVVGPYVSNIVAPNAGNFCTGSLYTLIDSVSGGVWSSSDTTIAKVSSTGVVTPVATGSTSIFYTLTACGSNVDATATVNVGVTPAGATLTGSSVICPSSNVTLTPSITGGVWSASNSSATVSAGVVSYGAPGMDTISYAVNSGFCSTISTFNVVSAPFAGSIVGSNLSCLSNATSTTLSDAVPGGTWISASPSIATIDATTGVMTAVSYGNVIISYMVPFTSCGDTAYATKSVGVRSSPPMPSPIIASTATVCQGGTITISDTTAGGTWGRSSTVLASVSTYGSDSAVVSGILGGTVSISYSLTANGCVSARILTLTVAPYPVVAAVTGSANACVSASMDTLFDATGGGTWTSGNTALATIDPVSGVITGVDSGTLTMSYAVTNSCGTTTVSKIVTVNPAPNPGFITGTSSVCVNQTVTLTETATSGSWGHSTPHCGITTSGLLTGESAGIDTITFRAATTYCGMATAKFPITINPLPARGTILGSTVICTGVPTTFADSNFIGTGAWYSVNSDTATVAFTVDTFGIVTGLIPGTDTLKYVVTDLVHGCGQDSAIKVLKVQESPNAGRILGNSILCTGSTETLRDTLANVSSGVWHVLNGKASISGSLGSVVPHSPGVDTVTYTVSTLNCGTNVVTFNLVVTQSPATTAISGPSSICIGTGIVDTFKEVATGYNTIRWYSLSDTGYINATTGAMRGIRPGHDEIMCVVASTSCGSDTLYKTITVNAPPSAGTISGPHSSICVGTTDTLIDAQTGGTWTVKVHNSTIDTATTGSYLAGVVKGTKGGVDTVVYTYTNVCGSATAIFPLTINALAQAGVISGSGKICQNDSVAFSDTSSGGIWLVTNDSARAFSDGKVYGDSVGSDTLLYVVTNTCNSDTARKPLTISKAPYAGVIRGMGQICKGIQIYLTDSIAGGVWSQTGHNLSFSSRPDTGIAIGLIPGVDTVKYRFSNGCGADSAMFPITVNPLPAAIPITTHTPTHLCINTMYQNFGVDSVADSGMKLEWTVTNADLYATDTAHQYCLVNFTQPGTGVVKITNVNKASGCAMADSFKVQVDSLNSAPMSQVIYVSPEFFSLDNSATSYLWGYDDAVTKDSSAIPGEINQSYYNASPDFKHKYYWVILNYGKCYQKVYYNVPTGVNELPTSADGFDMKLFPNPTTGIFAVEAVGGAEGTELGVKVLDITGKELKEQPLAYGKGAVNMDGFAPGLYMVVLHSGNLKLVTKTIVKN